MNLDTLHSQAATMSVDDWTDLWVRAAGGETISPDLPPFPPVEVQKLTNNMSGADTMRSAARFYRIANEEIARHMPPGTAQPVFLDFGAGWGRITRLFLQTIAPHNLHAIDVDERLVAAGQNCLPGTRFTRMVSGDPLPYAEAQFDVVIANSVFSHLSPAYHRHYIGEIARVTRPGGLALLTTLGPGCLADGLANGTDDARKWFAGLFPDMEAANATLAAGDMLHADTRRWPGYGLSFIPDSWLADNWPDFNIVSKRTDYDQDIQVAVRK